MGRSYDGYCAIAHALGVVGERWSLLVVRELQHGPLRYTDLHARLPGCSTNILAARLKELESGGVVAREKLPPPAAATVYALTPSGEALRPVLRELAWWAIGRLGPPPADTVFDANELAHVLRTAIPARGGARSRSRFASARRQRTSGPVARKPARRPSRRDGHCRPVQPLRAARRASNGPRRDRRRPEAVAALLEALPHAGCPCPPRAPRPARAPRLRAAARPRRTGRRPRSCGRCRSRAAGRTARRASCARGRSRRPR